MTRAKNGLAVRVTLLEWAGVPSHPAPMSSEILLCCFFKTDFRYVYLVCAKKRLTSKDILTLSFPVILSLLSFPYYPFLCYPFLLILSLLFFPLNSFLVFLSFYFFPCSPFLVFLWQIFFPLPLASYRWLVILSLYRFLSPLLVILSPYPMLFLRKVQ